MQAATNPADAAAGVAAGPAAAAQPPVAMDRQFIAQNQIVERYLAGRLPPKGMLDFEQYCRRHPELLDEIRLGDHLNAALRLLEAVGPIDAVGGDAAPLVGEAAGPAGRAVTVRRTGSRQPDQRRASHGAVAPRRSAAATARRSAARRSGIDALDPAGPQPQPGLRQCRDHRRQRRGTRRPEDRHEVGEIFRYEITIDRVDQGKVAILHNLLRDSNGDLRIALNSSALGPGDYRLSIDGLTWSGAPVALAWVTISIAR